MVDDAHDRQEIWGKLELVLDASAAHAGPDHFANHSER